MPNIAVMKEFYVYAFTCPALSKKEDKNRMKCAKQNYETFCGPKSCPVPGSWNHFRPQMEKKQKKQAKVEKPTKPTPIYQATKNTGKAAMMNVKLEKSKKVIVKRHRISSQRVYTPRTMHARPSLKKGTKKRALISFNQKNGQFARWGFDCVLTPGNKTPAVRILNNGSKRFYFPPGMNDADIQRFVGSWFLAQHLHNENKPINRTGSPELVRVELY